MDEKNNGTDKLRHPPALRWHPFTTLYPKIYIGEENPVGRKRLFSYGDFLEKEGLAASLWTTRQTIQVFKEVKRGLARVALDKGEPVRKIAPIYLFEGLARMAEDYEERFQHYRLNIEKLEKTRADWEDKSEFVGQPRSVWDTKMVKWSTEIFDIDFETCDAISGFIGVYPGVPKNVGWMSRLIEDPRIEHIDRLQMRESLEKWEDWFEHREFRLRKVLSRVKNESAPMQPRLPVFTLSQILRQHKGEDK